jgi:hypothetical protein
MLISSRQGKIAHEFVSHVLKSGNARNNKIASAEAGCPIVIGNME